MRTFSLEASDDEIKQLVVEWNELLANQEYQTALEMFPFSTREYDWTPSLLESVINGYGLEANIDSETLNHLLMVHKVARFVITTLIGRADWKDVVENKIRVDRNNLYGLDPDVYLGMIHYDDIPLSGFRSDLTARFNIKRIENNELTLEFYDIHVM
ncbi:MAG: hypothetical protein AAF614_17405 [Chloroflexota bacterium]